MGPLLLSSQGLENEESLWIACDFCFCFRGSLAQSDLSLSYIGRWSGSGRASMKTGDLSFPGLSIWNITPFYIMCTFSRTQLIFTFLISLLIIFTFLFLLSPSSGPLFSFMVLPIPHLSFFLCLCVFVAASVSLFGLSFSFSFPLRVLSSPGCLSAFLYTLLSFIALSVKPKANPQTLTSSIHKRSQERRVCLLQELI